MYSGILQSCNLDVLHRPLCADSDKIPEGGTYTVLTYILHLFGFTEYAGCDGATADGQQGGVRSSLLWRAGGVHEQLRHRSRQRTGIKWKMA